VTQLSSDQFFAGLAESTDGLAALVADHDLNLAIPTCPEWTMKQLATHVGRAHRWAAEITSTRSPTFIEFRAVPDGKFPSEPVQQAAWLRAGADRLIDAVRAAGDDEVWSFTGMTPARFWARRMAHETVVHQADARLAVGLDPSAGIDPALAADGIDEWLTLMSGALGGGDDPRADALGPGKVLHVHATDEGLDGAGEWLICRGPNGVSVEPGHGKGDVALTGPAAGLLLVLMRRLPASDPIVTVHGDASVLAGWLDRIRF
jgi:uncharacterized protein (TIGR03083 family)